LKYYSKCFSRQSRRLQEIRLVTQGSVANCDFGRVIAPTFVALGAREDVTIIITAGGQPAIPVAVPSSACIALPYAQIMQELAPHITNRGYGTVNMAISHVLPIISAGVTKIRKRSPPTAAPNAMNSIASGKALGSQVIAQREMILG
jgi:acetaldehyde dehydrogenase (acetylating)